MSTTDYTPYVILDDVTMSKVNALLKLGRTMAEKSYPQLLDDFDRTIDQVRDRAECFIGSQNKPKTKPAYKMEGWLGKQLEKKSERVL